MRPLARSIAMSRLPPRTAGGSCAISSSGRSKSNSETSTKKYGPDPCKVIRAVSSNESLVDGWLCLADALQSPVFGQHRPQHLVVIPAVAQERAAQDAFLQGAVAAAVGHAGARLEPLRAEQIHAEVQHRPGAFREQAGAPELRTERETP